MPQYEHGDYILANELDKQIRSNVKLQQDDSDKWEMDVEITLDNLYHTWLGEKQVSGIWVRDKKLIKRMNELGASFLISEIRPRFNVNSQFSVLQEDIIDNFSSMTSERIMKKLKYDYWKYDIEYTDIELICDQIFNSLYIWLMISLMGGMRTYKGDKTKTVINKQEIAQTGGGVY